MKHFLKIHDGLDVLPLRLEIQRQDDLWNRHPHRLHKDSPHFGTFDIWVRYNDIKKYDETGDYRHVNDEHDSIWYPSYYQLPSLRPIIFGLMNRVEGERLGAVIIIKVPPGGKIKPHIDKGWHVDFYEKFHVTLQAFPGLTFHCGNETYIPRIGDIYWFDNKVEHWVVNDSPDDWITLVPCIRTHRYGRSL